VVVNFQKLKDMKRTGILLGLIMVVLFVQAQKTGNFGETRGEPAVNFASGEVEKTFVAPPEEFVRLKSAKAGKSEFVVTCTNFPEEAQEAFLYAVSIWESLISSSVPLKIQAIWGPMEENLLACGKPATFHMNFEGALVSDVYYPVALAEKLRGKDINSGQNDIVCSFNQSAPWYFGLDGNTPETRYDFVTAALHEIAHGLGFAGFFKDNGSMGYFNNGNDLPAIYDHFIFNFLGQQLADKSVFDRPSELLHNELTSGNLKFQTGAAGEQDITRVYAPEEWTDGASIYHLITGNGLMDPWAMKGRAIHHPGKTVIDILAEMGWRTVTFDFTELKDFEKPVAELPVGFQITTEVELYEPVARVMFSWDNFETVDSVLLTYDKVSEHFTGKIPFGYNSGNFQYYMVMYERNRLHKLPATAPGKTFSLRVGPDYKAPVLAHNPQKIISAGSAELPLAALASDNIGIKSVVVEYKVNGIAQDPFFMENRGDEAWSGKLPVPAGIHEKSTLEYRVIAEDLATAGNTKVLPSQGFYEVNVFQPQNAVDSYSTDFSNSANDFVLADFDISRIAGFSGDCLHTRHPYPVSAIEGEYYQMVAQLRYPVILQEGGWMTYKEVVLVEPGEPGAGWEDKLFCDYVIVEGSNSGGETWLPVTPGYDSRLYEPWATAFVGSTVNTKSQVVGNQNMFQHNTINLTEDTGFSAGDTVLFRFRLASDHSVSGWGWAIDDLEIQKGISTGSDVVALSGFNVYPNPFENRFYIDYNTENAFSRIEITVTDIFGKTVYRQTGVDAFHAAKIQVELPDVSKGMYLLTVTEENRTVYSWKLVKN
jgi:hypothetical protein